MEWSVETLNATVDRELRALPVDMRARFTQICQLIAAVGLERMGARHVKHLIGPFWEMRMTAGMEYRARSMSRADGKRVVVVRVFVKKTSRTRRREIDLALRRAREVAK